MITLQKRKSFLFLCLLVTIGMILRVLILIKSGSFWFDEIISVEIAKRSIADSWKYIVHDAHPPLHFWLLHFWGRVFGFGEFESRSLFVAIGAWATLPVYLLSRKLFGSRPALVASAVYIFSPFSIYLSNQVRPYALVLFFTAWNGYFFLRLIKENGKVINFTCYTLSLTLLLFTHYLGFLVLLPQFVFILYSRKRSKNILFFFISLIISFLIFSPFAIDFISDKYALYEQGLLRRGWYFQYFPFGSPLLLTAPVFFMSNITGGLLADQVNTFISLVLGIFLFYTFRKNYNLEGKTTLSQMVNQKDSVIFLALSFVIPLAFSSLTFGTQSFRYYSMSALYLYILIGLGAINFADIFIKKFKWLLVRVSILYKLLIAWGVVCFLLLSLIFYSVSIRSSVTKGSWREIADFIETSKPDLVLAYYPAWVVGQYVDLSQSPNIKYYFTPKEMKPTSDMLDNVAHYNFIIPDSEDLEYVRDQLQNIIPVDSHKIVYVDMYTPSSQFVRDFLGSKGFQCVNSLSKSYGDYFFALEMEKVENRKNLEIKCY